jgi:hypothetical protein
VRHEFSSTLGYYRDMTSATSAPDATRRWARHNVKLPIRVIFTRGGQTVIADGQGSEVNAGGICLFADVELSVGQIIQIELSAPRSRLPVKIQGVVRNRRAYSYGIAFLPNTIEEHYQALMSLPLCNRAD